MFISKKILAASLCLMLCATTTFSNESSPKAVAQPTRLALLDAGKIEAASDTVESPALVIKSLQPATSSDLVSNTSGLILILFGLIGFIMRAIRARV